MTASEQVKRNLSLWIEVTEACQYKCRFCYNEWRAMPARFHRPMSFDLVPQIAAMVRRFSREFNVSLTLAGGDASAHPRFVDIVTVLANEAPIDVVSHGGNIELGMLDHFSSLGNVALQLSIPSCDEVRYRYLTGGGDLDRVTEIALYTSFVSMPLSISVVLTKINMGDAGPMAYFASEVGAGYVIFNRFLSAGRGAHYEREFSISADEFIAAIESAVASGRSRGLAVYVSGALPGVRIRKLESPKMTIGVDGAMRVCSLDSAVLGGLDEPPERIVGRYNEFWRSTQSLEACFCSNL